MEGINLFMEYDVYIIKEVGLLQSYRGICGIFCNDRINSQGGKES